MKQEDSDMFHQLVVWLSNTVGQWGYPGIAMLMASAAAGLLWDRFGAYFTFYAGATFAALALMFLVLEVWRQRQLSEEPR